MNYCRATEKGSLVDRSLDFRLQSVQTVYYFKWSCVNLVFLIAFGVEIFVMERFCSPCRCRYCMVYSGTFFVGFSFLVCFCKYLLLAFENEPGVGTEDQKRLLDCMNKCELDTILDLPNIEPPSCDREEVFIPIKSSWNRCSSSTTRLQKQNLCKKKTFEILQDESRILCPEDYLTDPRQLPALIWRAERERNLLEESFRAPKVQHSSSNEMSQRLKNTVYKLSPPPVSNRPLTFEEFGTWHTQKISSGSPGSTSVKMNQYVANLKSWFQTTILKRLVREMDFVSNVLQQRGFVNLDIGSVDRDTLRRTVEGQRIMLPVLPTVMAFLNIAGDHRYLVQRIRELADSDSNSCNSGVRLPTDAAILFHLFCVYLDTQLKPILGYESPFSTLYVIQREPEQCFEELLKSVKNCANFFILVTNSKYLRRPRFDYICGGHLYSSTDQRDSPFPVIIEFLMHMRQHQDSILEGVSLGRSGINIMWVIGESKEDYIF